jgi:hypothetical protein
VNFLWFLAIMQAAYVASCIVSGRVYFKRGKPIERDTEPQEFWFFVIVLGLSVPVIVAAAIFPSFGGR